MSKKYNIICCCAYRHPNSDITKFSQHLQETLCTVANEDKMIHIMGDFNIDLLNYGHHTLTDDFINLIFSSHLIPSILHPTRITDTSSTLIDNIFVSNASDCNILSGNLLSMISDHLPQFAILKDNMLLSIKTHPILPMTTGSLTRLVFYQNIQSLIYPILMIQVLI